jgi:hypothetical protein
MQEETTELIKKFVQDYEIYIDASDALTYWIIHARIPSNPAEGVHHLHHGKKFISGPNEDGNVLILSNPESSDAYSAESWGKMETIDDFVKKALVRILEDKDAADKGQEEGCGTSCG